MIRLSKLTDYAVVVLTEMTRVEPGTGKPAVFTAPALADRTAAPVPTVQKVLKLLARDGIVVSTRGAAGGYSLARPADRISVAEIITAIDGPIALTDCVDGGEGSCGVQPLCPMRGNWDKVNRAVRTALDGVSLADMAVPSLPAFEVTAKSARGAVMAG
ncbi:SUF system Fe-S cluster assembly regulator [Indioceanicola profundi]|uniref:SUF system Fe-S cluster assembly regulator n=1 Tax=Indioceanicola profundi TaxID=2220096 RepID=UPI000E6A9FEF|nr:SUF system Fe-S cluster assembly regulator [Indioceanicola profundi]